MLTSDAYTKLDQIMAVNPIIRNNVKVLQRLVQSSKNFLEPLSDDEERPFPTILGAAKYIIGFGLAGRPAPQTVSEFRERIEYCSSVENMFSSDAKYPFAAILHLVPALGFFEGLKMLWRFIEQLSFLGAIYTALTFFNLHRAWPLTDGWLTDEIQQILATLSSGPCVIRQELMPFLETALNLLEEYWENPTYGLHVHRKIFFPPNIIRKITPRVLPQAITTLEIEALLPIPRISLPASTRRPGSDPFGMGGLPETDTIPVPPNIVIQGIVQNLRLVFSGGYCKSIEVVGDPVKVDPPDDLPVIHDVDYYLTRIKPTTPIEGTRPDIRPGALNFIHSPLNESIEEYLTSVRTQLGITSRRFWIPWDQNEENFLWIGPPIMSFTVPEWIMVGQNMDVTDQLPYAIPVELWGAQTFHTEIDNNPREDISVDRNHKKTEIWLPRNMEYVTEQRGGWTLTYYMPRRYNNRIRATCQKAMGLHVIESSFETGVTYPIKIRYLGATVGQTIGSGSVSNFPALQHIPRIQNRNPWGVLDEYDIKPPLVSDRWTWIRIFAEHNAPPPYFCPPYFCELYYIPAKIECTIRKADTGTQIPCHPSIDTELFHYGVLSIKDPPEPRWPVWSAQEYDKVRRLGSQHAFSISFYPMESGTYTIEGTIDFTDSEKNRLGITSNPVTFAFNFYIQEPNPNYLEIYWVKVQTGGQQGLTGNPVTDKKLHILEEWLRVFVPSVRFRFYRGGSITVRNPQIEGSRILDKVESKRGGRSGVFIAVMTREIHNQLVKLSNLGGQGRGSTGVAWSIDWYDIIAHEMGHALGYHHIPASDEPKPHHEPDEYYYRPQGGFYPFGHCGEHPLIPNMELGDLPSTFSLKRTPPGCKDIMTYDPQKFFSLAKCKDFCNRVF